MKIRSACGNLLRMKKYRVAEYKRVESEGRDYLFLVADKAIFEVDPETGDLLAEWGRRPEFTREEALASLESMPRKEGEALLEDLFKRRAIIPATGPGGPRTRGAPAPMDIPLKTLILHVAESCNLECRYCYHAEKGNRKGAERQMSRDVAFRAVDFLFERSGGLEDLVLVFFGGEPLLNFEIIRGVAGYARKRRRRPASASTSRSPPTGPC